MMKKVPLSEKIGAMGVVDELRRQQMQVQEHLDLPKRRDEIAASIRTYYQSHNIDFDDELIDQGVREFFSQRLVFEQPALSWSDRVLCRWLLRRDKPQTLSPVTAEQPSTPWWSVDWKEAKRLFVIFAVVSIVLMLVRYADWLGDQSGAADAVNSYYSIGHRLERSQRWHQVHPQVAISQQLSDSVTQFQQMNQLLGLQPDHPLDYDNKEKWRKDLAGDEQKLQQFESLLQQVKRNLEQIAPIFDARWQLMDIVGKPAYEKAAWQFDVLKRQTEQTRQAIEAIDRQGVGPANQAIAELKQVLDQASQIQSVIKTQADLERQMRQMPLPPQDVRQLQKQSMLVSSAVGAFSAQDAARHVYRFKSTVEFAEQPLQLDIVDKDGVRPAIERCIEQTPCNLDDDSTQGKRWYAIVQARNSQGDPFYTSLIDPTTGEWDTHEFFAVPISRGEYLNIKEDRLSDGRIDNRTIGYKAANSLSLTFNARVMKNADLILTW